MLSKPNSCLARLTISIVLSRVSPLGAYVTEMKPGRSFLTSDRVSISWVIPSSVFGGENSREKTRRF
jgi:hypothetical protein